MKPSMSEVQFYVSVAVMPAVTVIIVPVGVLLNNRNMNARFNDMNGRFNDLSGRFDDVNARIDDLRKETVGCIDDLRKQTNERMIDLRDTLRAEASKNHSEMLVKFAELDSRLLRLEGSA